MAEDLTSFQRELDTPGAGTQSELYRALAPLLDLHNLPEAKNKFDQERLNNLKNDFRKGTVGLEYLTGLKNNKAETFYDKHPVQALTSDVLANSGTIGAGVAAGTPLLNAIRQGSNLKKMMPAYNTRKGDPAQSMLEKLAPVGKEGKRLPVTDPHVLNMFGSLSATPDMSEHAKIIENLNSSDPKLRTEAHQKAEKTPMIKRLRQMDLLGGDKDKYLNEYASLLNSPAATEEEAKLKGVRIRQYLDNLYSTPEHLALGEYAEAHKGLRDAGKNLKSPVFAGLGEKLREKVLTGDLLEKHPKLHNILGQILPDKDQPLRDWINATIGKQHPENMSPEMIQQVLENAVGGDRSMLANDIARNSFARTTAGKTLRRLGPAGVIGGGIAAGGLGLHAALKALQNQVYGKEQINEWKRNMLRSRGEFEEANRIK